MKTIQFRNHTLHVGVTEEGEPVVAIKPMCENLGLNVGVQQRKIQGQDSGFNWTLMRVVSADGAQRDMLCVPVRQINFWLAGINPNKVKPETREEIKQYRAEVMDVLFNHFLPTAANAGQDLDRKFTVIQTALVALQEQSHALQEQSHTTQKQITELRDQVTAQQTHLEDVEEQLTTYMGKDGCAAVSAEIKQFALETGMDGRTVWGMIRRDVGLSSYRNDIQHAIVSYLRRLRLGIHSVK